MKNNTVPTSRAGSHAGRGFRYQDAIGALLAIEILCGERPSALTIPEGGDDIELRAESANFVQVKSRREQKGLFAVSQIQKFIDEQAVKTKKNQNTVIRSFILEREIRDGASHSWNGVNIDICESPKEKSIELLMSQLSLNPLAAEYCFLNLVAKVGNLADENGTKSPENYLGLSPSDTDKIIQETVAAFDIEAMEEAISSGLCESVDFLTPSMENSFYLGTDITPGHIASGLLVEQPEIREDVIQGLNSTGSALIVGQSGSGKSGLMWDCANAIRHNIRWLRINRLGALDVPVIKRLLSSYRCSEQAPIGLIFDDVGRKNLEGWNELFRETRKIPGLLLLGSIREEDNDLIAQKAGVFECRVAPDETLAERIWTELRERGQTSWQGWKEAWQTSEGLLLEYVYILTQGARLEKILSDQVQARMKDQTRQLELEIIRVCSMCDVAGIEVDIERLKTKLGAQNADMSSAISRLREEHLVITTTKEQLAGLHQVRSEKLVELTHHTPPPSRTNTLEIALDAVSSSQLSALISTEFIIGEINQEKALGYIYSNIKSSGEISRFNSALAGLARAQVSKGVEDWLALDEVEALRKSHISIAAWIGASGVDFSGTPSLNPQVLEIANVLNSIKTSQTNDLRFQLIKRFSEQELENIIGGMNPIELAEFLGNLVGAELSEDVRLVLNRTEFESELATLKELREILGVLTYLDRGIAENWVTRIGQEHLTKRVENEFPWASKVNIFDDDDGRVIHCDYWYLGAESQKDTHWEVCELCETIIAICPSADFAKSAAIMPDGEKLGVGDFAVADKRIPRANLLPKSVPNWNRLWIDYVNRRISTLYYTEYLAEAAEILSGATQLLEQIFDAHLRGKDKLSVVVDELNELHQRALDLRAQPIETQSDAGAQEVPMGAAKLQNLLASITNDLVSRFSKLPNQANAHAAWMSDRISETKDCRIDEPWELIDRDVSEELDGLEMLLTSLQFLALMSNYEKKPPLQTWLNLAKQARKGNAIKSVGLRAKSAYDKQIEKARAKIEVALKSVDASAEVFVNIQKNVPPPKPNLDALVLVRALDFFDTIEKMHNLKPKYQDVLDWSVELTILPVCNDLAVAQLAISGYQTLLPSPDKGIYWVNKLKKSVLDSPIFDQYEKTITLSEQMVSFEKLGLGSDSCPEVEQREKVQIEMDFKQAVENLGEHMSSLPDELSNDMAEILKRILAGELMPSSIAKSALESEIVAEEDHAINFALVNLQLLDFEFAMFNASQAHK